MNRSEFQIPAALGSPSLAEHALLKQQPSREAVSDGVITARVRMELLGHAITAAHEIHVNTIAGVVELSGFVETVVVGGAAVLFAQNVDGVLDVTDAMDIRTPE
jgi:hyperosmotically inducible periplasmic protein